MDGRKMPAGRIRFQRGDLAAAAGVLVLAAVIFACFLPMQKAVPARAEIYRNGEWMRTVSLSQEQEFTIEGKYRNTVAVRDGKIAVVSSDCPGEDCVGCGWISGAGRSIVCLPNGLEIRVVGDENDVDLVVR